MSGPNCIPFLDFVSLGMASDSGFPNAAPASPRPPILVVEDDEMIMRILIMVLSEEGYLVLSAQGEEEAVKVQFGYQGPIPLLLTDMRLRQGSGVETARRIMAARPEIAVIYMSGHPWEDFKSMGLLREKDAFLPKPFHINSFRDLVRREYGHVQPGNG
jgi:DNA-binding response OmpR family regulator